MLFSMNLIPLSLVSQGWKQCKHNTRTLQKNGRTASKCQCRHGNKHTQHSCWNYLFPRITWKMHKKIRPSLQLFARRQHGTIHLGLAAECYAVLILCCFLQRPWTSILKRKLFLRKLMQNIQKTILKALKIRTLVRKWKSIFKLSLYSQLYLAIPPLQNRLTTVIVFMVLKLHPQYTALYCRILLKELHCRVHSVQMPLKK